jgi:hypothetical protein
MSAQFTKMYLASLRENTTYGTHYDLWNTLRLMEHPTTNENTIQLKKHHDSWNRPHHDLGNTPHDDLLNIPRLVEHTTSRLNMEHTTPRLMEHTTPRFMENTATRGTQHTTTTYGTPLPMAQDVYLP